MKLDQTRRDRQRKIYRLDFPREMTTDMFSAFIRSVSGTLRTGVLNSSPTIALEMWSTDEGIRHYIKIPSIYAREVVPQLRGHVPGMTLTVMEDETKLKRTWSSVVELRIKNSAHQLFIQDPAEVAHTLLQSVETIEEGQVVMTQIVFSPLKRQSLPQFERARAERSTVKMILRGNEATRDEVQDRRVKLEDMNVGAVIRIATMANTKHDADYLRRGIMGSIRGLSSARARIGPRVLTPKQILLGLDLASTPAFPPMQLSSSELAALSGWPFGSPSVAGLPPYMPRQFPPALSIPNEGIIIGQSSFAGKERRVAIGYEEALMHTHVIGKTGTGKSVLLANMARQIMDAGYGLIMIETEGNLYQSVLDYVPKSRIDDVVLMDVSDTSWPVSFNVLDQGTPQAGVTQLKSLLRHKYQLGQWANEYLTNSMLTILDVPGLSFIDIPALLSPRASEREWADHVARQVKDDELKRWWQTQDHKEQGDFQRRAETVLSRLNEISMNPQLRAILGQSKSTINISDIMKANKILLVNLKGVDKDASDLVGTLLMNTAWEATKSTFKQKPTFIMLDEFGGWMNLPTDTESMLAQARKHNVGMILAHQHMTQLTPEMRDGVITNARSKIILESSSTDAKMLLDELGSKMDIEDITHLPAFHALAKIHTPTGNASPTSIQTFPSESRTGNTREVVKHSREVFARPYTEVMNEIRERRTIKPSSPPPPVGGYE